MGFQRKRLKFMLLPKELFQSFLLTGEQTELKVTEDDVENSTAEIYGLGNHSISYGIEHLFETTITYENREFNAKVTATMGQHFVFGTIDFEIYPDDNMSE